jgi:hypothetical protein
MSWSDWGRSCLTLRSAASAQSNTRMMPFDRFRMFSLTKNRCKMCSLTRYQDDALDSFGMCSLGIRYLRMCSFGMCSLTRYQDDALDKRRRWGVRENAWSFRMCCLRMPSFGMCSLGIRYLRMCSFGMCSLGIFSFGMCSLRKGCLRMCSFGMRCLRMCSFGMWPLRLCSLRIFLFECVLLECVLFECVCWECALLECVPLNCALLRVQGMRRERETWQDAVKISVERPWRLRICSLKMCSLKMCSVRTCPLRMYSLTCRASVSHSSGRGDDKRETW